MELFVEFFHENLQGSLWEAMIKQVCNVRRGEVVEIKCLNTVIKFYDAISLDKARLVKTEEGFTWTGKKNERKYRIEFEDEFLKSTDKFYTETASLKLAHLDASEYINEVYRLFGVETTSIKSLENEDLRESFLSQGMKEKMRKEEWAQHRLEFMTAFPNAAQHVCYYLPEKTQGKVMRILQDSMITKQAEFVMDKPSGVEFMLKQDLHQQLKQMWLVFLRGTGCVD